MTRMAVGRGSTASLGFNYICGHMMDRGHFRVVEGEKFSHNMLEQILFFFYTGKIIFVVLLQTDGILNINIDFPFHPCISVSMLQL